MLCYSLPLKGKHTHTHKNPHLNTCSTCRDFSTVANTSFLRCIFCSVYSYQGQGYSPCYQTQWSFLGHHLFEFSEGFGIVDYSLILKMPSFLRVWIITFFKFSLPTGCSFLVSSVRSSSSAVQSWSSRARAWFPGHPLQPVYSLSLDYIFYSDGCKCHTYAFNSMESRLVYPTAFLTTSSECLICISEQNSLSPPQTGSSSSLPTSVNCPTIHLTACSKT